MNFKSHLAEFILCRPRALYMSLTQNDVDHKQHQKQFIEAILETARSRIQFEDELPSWWHWQRTCWMSNMLSQATSSHMSLLDFIEYGWRIVDGKLGCDWEAVENQVGLMNQIGLRFHVQVSFVIAIV